MDNRQAFKGSKQEEQLFAIERSLTEALVSHVICKAQTCNSGLLYKTQMNYIFVHDANLRFYSSLKPHLDISFLCIMMNKMIRFVLQKMCQKEIARMSLEKLTLEKHLRIQRELEKVQRPEVLSNLQGPPDLKVNIIPGIDFNMDFTQEVNC